MDVKHLLSKEEINLFIENHKDLIEQNKTLFYPYYPTRKTTTWNVQKFLNLFYQDIVLTREIRETNRKNLHNICLKLSNMEKEEKLNKFEKINLVGRYFMVDSDKISNNDYLNYSFFGCNVGYTLIKITKQTKNFIWFVKTKTYQNKIEEAVFGEKEFKENILLFIDCVYDNEIY